MSLHTIDLTAKLSNAEMAAICAESNTKDPRKAVARFFKQAVNAAAVRAAYPRPHRPNAATARALRARPSRNDKTFATTREFSAYLKKFVRS